MDEPGRGAERLEFLSRDELEKRVRRRTSELENVMDAMADVLIKLDEQGSITMISGAVTDILGYEAGALEGKPIDMLLAEPPAGESPVTSSSQLLEQLIREGRVTDVEIYFSTVDGETVPMSLSASTLTDGDGVPTGIVCVATDITERKAAEDRAEFLYSLLRHDLGNSLQVASGYLDLLADCELGETEREHVERSRDAVSDAFELIERVRTLDKIDDSEPTTTVQLGAVIEQAVDRYDTLSDQQGVRIETDIDDVPVLAGELVAEIFTNLIENALTHSNADRLRLTTAVDPETVTVRVEDDGDGIEPDEREKIFRQGYSTGDTTNSGLGMYIVSELVESYGGEVTLSDSDLGGARFDVTLQRCEPEA